MKGAIFGFQRCWRWPKWAPDSRSWRMENSGKAIDSVSFTGWPDVRVIPRSFCKEGDTGRRQRNTRRKPPARARWRAYTGSGAPLQRLSAATKSKHVKGLDKRSIHPLRNRVSKIYLDRVYNSLELFYETLPY